MGSEITFIIPYVAGLAALMTFGGTIVIWVGWKVVQRWVSGPKREGQKSFRYRSVALPLLWLTVPASFILASQPITQPESARLVAAFEVPLQTEANRADFLELLRREAAVGGLDVTIESDENLWRLNEMSPDFQQTIGVYIRRGAGGRGNEVWISDRYHSGYPWIAFSRGDDPSSAQRFRDQLMRQVSDRWPNTLSIPITATGGLPHKADLLMAERGYEIDPARAAGYTCDPTTGPKAAPPEACR